jgi:hypothetical protein
MIIALSFAIIFGIIQGINSSYNYNRARPQPVPHTDNLLEYIFNTKY